MSDTNDGWRRPDPTQPAATTPPPPPPPPPPAPSAAPETDEVVAVEAGGGGGRSKRLLVGVACVAAVALLVAALALVRRAGSERAGADSPEAAADDLFAALENEDLIALAELLHPGERRTIAEPVFDIVDELVRLELIDPSIDLAGVSGIDLRIEGLQYRLDPVPGADDMREIVIERGTLTAITNGEELPIGPTLRERFAGELDALDSDDIAEYDQPETGELGPVLVEHDGRWYFSIWHTVAEAARRGSGIDAVPALADVVPSVGAESPEAAIDAMIEAASGLDLGSIIGMLDPEETAALYRYAPLFLEEAQAQLDDVLDQLDASDVRWSVSEIDYTSETDGDVGYVTVNSFTAKVDAEGVSVELSYSPSLLSVDVVAGDAEYSVDVAAHDNTIAVDGLLDGDPLTAEITFAEGSIAGSAEIAGEKVQGSLTIDPAGECSRFEITAETDTGNEAESGCLEDELSDAEVESLALGLANFEDFSFPTPTLVTTRTDGEWYFSPLLTLSNAVLSYLRSTDADEVAQQIDLFQELLESEFPAI